MEQNTTQLAAPALSGKTARMLTLLACIEKMEQEFYSIVDEAFGLDSATEDKRSTVNSEYYGLFWDSINKVITENFYQTNYKEI